MHARSPCWPSDDRAGLRAAQARWAGSARRTRPSARSSRRWPRRSCCCRTVRCSEAADALARLSRDVPRLGGSDAQREIVEETRICALLRAGRYDDARVVLDDRIDRSRQSPRDERLDEARELPRRPTGPPTLGAST